MKNISIITIGFVSIRLFGGGGGVSTSSTATGSGSGGSGAVVADIVEGTTFKSRIRNNLILLSQAPQLMQRHGLFQM